MSKLTDDFIRIFEQIVSEVHRRGRVKSHAFDIETAAARDGMVRKNQALLVYIRNIRNLIQHPKHRSDGYAIHISEGFLQEVDALLNYLKNPPKARTVGVARKKLKTALLTDRLGKLAEKMKQNGFSHLPILGEEGEVIGVFNEAAVFDYMSSQDEVIIGREMQVEEIINSCRIDANHTEKFKFIRPVTPLEELIELFGTVESSTTRIGAVFVTASGKSSEPLQRMITPWDVLTKSKDV